MINAATATTCRLPTCVFVGPQKAGTSWIHEYLSARGDICLPRGVKETFFFDDRFERKGLDWYLAHFQPTGNSRQTIEVAPTYFQSDLATARISQTLPQVPIIVTLRHPAERAFSLFLHLRRYGFHDLPLRRAVIELPQIVDSSRYAKHLERWYEQVGASHVHVLFQEDLAQNPVEFASRLDRILDLPPVPSGFDIHSRVNEAAVPASGRVARLARQAGDFLRDYRLYWPIELAKQMGFKQLVYGRPGKKRLDRLLDEDRQWLIEQLRPDTERLQAMLDRDLSAWLQ
ncbi:MAG: sulfotransferase [Pirellulaceae bacterium]